MSSVVIEKERKSMYYEKLTVDNTVGGVGFTASKITTPVGVSMPRQQCQEAYCTLETAAIRFTLDGTAPTTTVGHLLSSGDILVLRNPDDIQNFKAIRTTGTSGDLHVTYKY